MKLFGDHWRQLRFVFKKVLRHNGNVKESKGEFFTKEVSYFRFKVTHPKILKNNEKVEDVKNAKESQNVTELRSFLGLVAFYDKFVPNLAI